MRVDSHQHYWKVERNDYGWLKPSLTSMYKDYLPEHLKPHLERFRIDKTVIVQAAPTTEETDFMLQIADREETVAGVVGWLDLTADDFAQKFDHYRKHPKFVGFRPMIQDLPSEWIVGEKVIERLKQVEEAEFTIDLQANPRHLPYLLNMMERVPNLRAVIDHIAKPPMAQGEMEPWATGIARLAAFPNMMCKLSGMVPGKTGASWSGETMKPYAAHVIETFGKKRIMFGSDWPVCLYSATYEQVVDLFEYCLGPEWSAEERADAYGGNAIRFYKLQGRQFSPHV